MDASPCDSSSKDRSNIKVICRIRPLNKKELDAAQKPCVIPDADGVSVSVDKQSFTFDRVVGPQGTQVEVYDFIAKPILEDICAGINGTIFAYGQTSSGKTHTMQGPSIDDEELKGIIPRVMENVFEKLSAHDQVESGVKISLVEIYNEKIRDLFDPSKNDLKIREEKKVGIYIDQLTEFHVTSAEKALDLLKMGQANRSISFTQMNAESSRSHSVFVVTVIQKDNRSGFTKTSKLYLVDLAGSEKVGKTGAAGQTLEEAKNINKSLSALGQVIKALTETKATHIPYRNSKLTRILQESLGGNARTALCINCSPAEVNIEETLSTMRFGARAKTIQNKAKVNIQRSTQELEAMLGHAEHEMELQRQMIATLQKQVEVMRSAMGNVSVASPQIALEPCAGQEMLVCPQHGAFTLTPEAAKFMKANATTICCPRQLNEMFGGPVISTHRPLQVDVEEKTEEANGEDANEHPIEDDDDDDMWEIMDYSCVSQWERTTAEIEDALLALGTDDFDEYNVIAESFILEYFNRNRMLLDDDQEILYSQLQLWFDLDNVLVLEPTIEDIVDPNVGTAMLSSLAIALHNSHCHVPVLLSLQETSRGCYIGYGISDHHITRFETNWDQYPPRQMDSFAELLCYMEMSIEKLLPHVGRARGQLCVEAIHSFISADDELSINTKNGKEERSVIEDLKVVEGDGITNDVVDPIMQPNDAVGDPVVQIRLAVQWPQTIFPPGKKIPELDINDARAEWSLSAQFSDGHCGVLTCRLRALATAWQEAAKHSTQLATPHKFPVNKAVHTTSKEQLISQTPEKIAQAIDKALHELFLFEADYKTSKPEELETIGKVEAKGSPPRSLMTALVEHLAQQHSLQSMARLWQEFVEELRWFWDEGIAIPRVGLEPVDHRYSLIYQKLQVLALCIAKKNREEKGDADAECKCIPVIDKDKFVVGSSDCRKHVVQGLLLANQFPMYEPYTREAPPTAFDDVQDHLAFLQTLHLEPQEAQLRSKAYSKVLVSDMQAFKAANPGCIFEDFLSWRSEFPRIDVEPDMYFGPNPATQPQKQLQNSLLRKVWDAALPLPAALQPPLFDHSKEAERTLHYLDTITTSDLWKQLFECALVSVFHSLNHSLGSSAPAVQAALLEVQQLGNEVCTAGALNRAAFADLIDVVAKTESILRRIASLLMRLPDISLVEAMCEGNKVNLTSDQRNVGLALFEASKRFDPNNPDVRQYTGTLPMHISDCSCGFGSLHTKGLAEGPMSPISDCKNAQPPQHRIFVRITNNGFRFATKVHVDR